jgi:hypothetical protein
MFASSLIDTDDCPLIVDNGSDSTSESKPIESRV